MRSLVALSKHTPGSSCRHIHPHHHAAEAFLDQGLNRTGRSSLSPVTLPVATFLLPMTSFAVMYNLSQEEDDDSSTCGDVTADVATGPAVPAPETPAPSPPVAGKGGEPSTPRAPRAGLTQARNSGEKPCNNKRGAAEEPANRAAKKGKGNKTAAVEVQPVAEERGAEQPVVEVPAAQAAVVPRKIPKSFASRMPPKSAQGLFKFNSLKGYFYEKAEGVMGQNDFYHFMSPVWDHADGTPEEKFDMCKKTFEEAHPSINAEGSASPKEKREDPADDGDKEQDPANDDNKEQKDKDEDSKEKNNEEGEEKDDKEKDTKEVAMGASPS